MNADGIGMSTKNLLKEFARVSQDLADALESNCKLKDLECRLLENYLLVIQLAYRQWKGKNVPPV
jgi:hypothetical protein